MPQMTASTARRSTVRRARSSGERLCPCDEVAAHTRASAAIVRFIGPPSDVELEGSYGVVAQELPLDGWRRRAVLGQLRERPLDRQERPVRGEQTLVLPERAEKAHERRREV